MRHAIRARSGGSGYPRRVFARLRFPSASLGAAVALTLVTGGAGCSVYGVDLLDASNGVGGSGGDPTGRGGSSSLGGFGGVPETSLRGPTGSTSSSSSSSSGEGAGSTTSSASSASSSTTTTTTTTTTSSSGGDPASTSVTSSSQASSTVTSTAAGPAPLCGDDDKNQSSEQCDGDDLGGTTCVTLLGTGATGSVKCTSSCKLDATACKPPPPPCGNGKLDAGEECDDGNATGNDGCVACTVVCLENEHKGPNAHCYIEAGPKSSWNDAFTACANSGGYLATLTSLAENDFVWGILDDVDPTAGDHDARWIGLTDKTTEGKFLWVSGEAFSFESWATGEPNNQNGGEDCAELRYEYNEWNDESCTSDTRYFVCEYDPPVKF